MPLKSWTAALMLAVAGLAMAGCKIVPIVAEQTASQKGAAVTERASALWHDKAVAYFEADAKPAPDVLAAIAADLGAAGAKYGRRAAAEGAPWTFLVSGSGTVKEKNTQSRAGTLVVTLDGAATPTDLVLQIGPVIRGNGIRDNLPFISFEDFENQIDFADMGKALNQIALKAIEAPAAAAAPGGKISFTGVISLSSPSDKIVATPVSMKVGP